MKSWARAEIQALMLRAGRGAGVPLGHAEDMALALAQFGDDAAVAAAARALEAGWRELDFVASEDKIVFPAARAIGCLPVAIDALSAGVPVAELQALDAPQLIDPYLAAASARVAIQVVADGEGWTLKRVSGDAAEPPRGVTGRFELADEVTQALTDLAARTYVPASSASREGAGAGANDDD